MLPQLLTRKLTLSLQVRCNNVIISKSQRLFEKYSKESKESVVPLPFIVEIEHTGCYENIKSIHWEYIGALHKWQDEAIASKTIALSGSSCGRMHGSYTGLVSFLAPREPGILYPKGLPRRT